MNVPPVTSIENALKIYYNHVEIGNAEMSVLFGRRSTNTLAQLKKEVKREMDNRGVHSYGLYKVNTAVAFETWGIDVADLEKRKKKIKELNLHDVSAAEKK